MAGYIVSEYMKRNAQRFSYKNFMESLNGIIDTDNTMYYYIYSIIFSVLVNCPLALKPSIIILNFLLISLL